MGKNLKGKEKYFETLPEAKNWLADARYEERHNLIVTSPDMTVDKWFEYWIENIVCDLAPNTKRNYQERYKWNIQPVIGAMCIADVKPMHCKAVLNRMETTYAGSTIRQAYITMGTMLKSAVMNDIIAKHPMNGVRYTKPVRAVDDIKYLTVDEQEKFLEAAARSHNYRQYALLLETGLRTAELIGLTWDSIDWKKRTLTVSKSLEYIDSRTGEKKCLIMHALRHTYATRAIERGVQPKVLQQLLGHASIKTTMDRYVHVTDESLVNAIRQFQQATPPVTKKGRKKGVQEI